MKLSFSTKGWHSPTFEQFCDVAKDLRFQGIELHNIYNRLFTDKDGAFHDYAAAATRRRLFEKGLDIPCIDTVCNASDGATDRAVEEITRCVEIAANLSIPCVRLKAADAEDKDAAVAQVGALVQRMLPTAEEQGVTLIIETSGLFANTAVLRDLLDSFACDHVAALWHWSAAYFGGGESPEQVIKNLGAYVRHVHVSDAVCHDGGLEYCLLGEGDLPVKELMLALRSVNYDGFISLVWDPVWCPELDDMEIILTQFVHYMRQFGDTARNESALYYNRAHTGKFVWEKDRLIDCTFSQVLDRMVEEFPDQYCFKYTTLDYTRTYAEFRDDVDQCARALIAAGVKAGTHVAVWASNVGEIGRAHV